MCQDRPLAGNSHHRRRTAAAVVGARLHLLTKTPLLVDHGHLDPDLGGCFAYSIDGRLSISRLIERW